MHTAMFTIAAAVSGPMFIWQACESAWLPALFFAATFYAMCWGVLQERR